jgi:SAM-dependent methyltransferase
MTMVTSSATRTIAICRVCSFCPGREFNAHGYRWLDCPECGTVQKVLTPEQYLGLSRTYDPGTYLDGASRAELERFLEIESAKGVLANLAPDLLRKTDRSFLDIGCGMGAYLLAAQSLGYEALGFEPSENHARVATKILNLSVIADYFSKERVGDRRFDLIMLSHVIEHIYAPADFLKEILAVLKPGGALVVVTPNADSLIARTLGERWPMLKPVDHVSMISARTYRSFALEEGLRMRHHYSEYPFEFAATVGSAVKAARRRASSNVHRGATGDPVAETPALRSSGLKTKLLRGALTVASMPFWLVARATDRQACLTTVIRK